MHDSGLGRSIAALIGVVLLSIAIAVPVVVVLSWPLIHVSETVLHVGCESSTIDGRQMWVCSDGIGYLLPGVALVVLLTVIGVIVGVYALRDAFGPPSALSGLATVMSLCAVIVALPVGGVVTLCGVLGVSAANGRWLVPAGLVIAVAAVAVLMALQRVRLRATADIIAAIVVVAALIPVGGLAIPLIVLLAGIFAVAGAMYSASRATGVLVLREGVDAGPRWKLRGPIPRGRNAEYRE